jgi:protein SCO1/2
MKIMKRLLFALVMLAAMARADAPESIYHLDAELTNQSGIPHHLDVHRGHPVLVTMFYGRCPMACPLLIDTMRAVERAAGPAEREQLRFLLVSIDPDHDTTEQLRTLASSRKLDLARWTLTRTDAASVRKIAAVLGVQYRALPDGQFNHSSTVTLLGADGVIEYQSSILGRADPELMAALKRVAQSKKAR